MKKVLSVLALAVMALMTVACHQDPTLTGIALDKDKLNLKAGEEATLTVSYTPEDAVDITAPAWETSNPAVATVAAGKVTAVDAGTATITAKVGTFSATCVVTVTKDEEPDPDPDPDPDPTEPEDNWDYTPGADYQDAANLWKPVDDANAVNFYYYNCTAQEWNGTDVISAEVPFLKKTSSTYRLYYPEATTPGEIWMKQFFIFPFDESHFVALDPEKTYDFKVTLAANKDCPGFFKLETYNPDHAKREGATIWEKQGGIQLTTEPQVIEKKGISGIECSNILLVFAFGGNSEETLVYIKDITLVESVGTEPVTDTYDYTPGEEYLAAGNLWKPVDDANALKYFYYSCIGTDWNGTETEATEVPFLTRSQSTFKLEYANATTQQWQNQFFFYPYDESHFIALDAAKTYKFKVTVQSPAEAVGFFKLSKYNPAAGPKYEGECFWEHGAISLAPNTPVVLEHEFTGVECSNIILLFDFGANSANTVIYIKDITLVDMSAPSDPENISGLIPQITGWGSGNATAYEVVLKDAVVSYVNGSNAYIEDATGAILYYKKNHGLEPGDILNGKISGTGYLYNGLPEITEIGTEVTVTKGGVIPETVVTIADLLADYPSFLSRRIKVAGVTVTDGLADNDRNGVITQGENTINLYSGYKTGISIETGAQGDLIAFPTVYQKTQEGEATKQLSVWESGHFTKAGN